MSAKWTQSEAIELCRQMENICPEFGCHVALTGGLLYKDGLRKDCDIVLYRIRQVEEIDTEGLFSRLQEIGFHNFVEHGFVAKAMFDGKRVDLFFPEAPTGNYEEKES